MCHSISEVTNFVASQDLELFSTNSPLCNTRKQRYVNLYVATSVEVNQEHP